MKELKSGAAEPERPGMDGEFSSIELEVQRPGKLQVRAALTRSESIWEPWSAEATSLFCLLSGETVLSGSQSLGPSLVSFEVRIDPIPPLCLRGP